MPLVFIYEIRIFDMKNQSFVPMKKLAILFSIIMLSSSSLLKAQEDDMYFTSRKDKKVSKTEKTTRMVEVVYETEEPSYVQSARVTATVPVSEVRDVDEYNRRGKYSSTSSVDTLSAEVQVTESGNTQTCRLSAQSLYDLGYSEGYEEGFSDGNDIDFYYGLRLARFHGCHYYAPWYWNRISYVYDPWHWDPWYWDPWYRPYYYGGWYSVGWGVGYYGSYWNPHWHGYYPGGYYPHHHWHGHYAHGPRVSTSRNQDYGRSRIVDRRGSVATAGRYNTRTEGYAGRTNRAARSSQDRATRMNERSTDRYNRVTNRSSNRTSERTSNRTSDRTTNRSADRSRRTESTTVDRSSSRSSNRSTTTSRFGGSSSSRGSAFGSPGGSSRSGGSRGGAGRGR